MSVMIQAVLDLEAEEKPGRCGWWWFHGTLTPEFGKPRLISQPALVGTGGLSEVHGVVIGGTKRFRHNLDGTWRFLGLGL
jgi:hypothetical protein